MKSVTFNISLRNDEEEKLGEFHNIDDESKQQTCDYTPDNISALVNLIHQVISVIEQNINAMFNMLVRESQLVNEEDIPKCIELMT